MFKKASGKEMTLKGFIVPNEWDDMDNVTQIGISTDNTDYVVELNELSGELFDYLYDDVEVSGIVTENRKREKKITIKTFKLLSDIDDLDEAQDFE